MRITAGDEGFNSRNKAIRDFQNQILDDSILIFEENQAMNKINQDALDTVLAQGQDILTDKFRSKLPETPSQVKITN